MDLDWRDKVSDGRCVGRPKASLGWDDLLKKPQVHAPPNPQPPNIGTDAADAAANSRNKISSTADSGECDGTRKAVSEAELAAGNGNAPAAASSGTAAAAKLTIWSPKVDSSPGTAQAATSGNAQAATSSGTADASALSASSGDTDIRAATEADPAACIAATEVGGPNENLAATKNEAAGIGGDAADNGYSARAASGGLCHYFTDPDVGQHAAAAAWSDTPICGECKTKLNPHSDNKCQWCCKPLCSHLHCLQQCRREFSNGCGATFCHHCNIHHTCSFFQ